MFTLKALGGAALEGPEGPVGGRPAQKRRLALLALLSMSRTNRLGREKLIGYLWPDRDEESARHLLSDAVYVLNRALGGDALSSAGDELRLNPERVACDARAFEEAAGRDPEAALRLYAGPFMDGFFLEGSEEFEAWVGRERERLAGLLAGALERVAAAREAAGDERGSIDAWRRLAAEDPYSTRAAVRLARALALAGDRGGALQAAQAHAALLKKELGLDVTPELRELIATLQAPAPPSPVSVPQAPDARLAAPPPEAVVGEGVAPSVPVTGPSSPPAAARAPILRRSPWLWAVTAVAAAAVLLAWLWRPAGSAARPQSVAVMPFEDVGGDGAYIGDGLADELTTSLGRATELKIAARTSAFALRSRQLDAREIGRTLGVDALVEGSVRRGADRVRVDARLVSTRDGYQIWSDSWERPIAALPALQDEISRAVLRVLQGERQTSTTIPARSADVPGEAYQLYLQGRYLWHQRTRDSLRRAAAAFEQAVARAPEYAEAHSGVADAYAVMGFYDFLPPSEAFPRARAAALRALELDAHLAQAHASLGYVALYYDWNWAEAEAAFARAIALNPSYSIGHQWQGNFLTAMGRFDEAVAAMRRAQEVDPLSLIARAALGWVHYYQRDFDAAVEQCRRTIELNPDFELAHLWAGWADEAAGRYASALEHLAAAVKLSSGGAVALASLGRAQALAGDPGAARGTLARLHQAHASYLPAYELAKLHLALGEPDAAIDWLRRAHAERSHSIVFLHVDPQLDALRRDPRFTELAAQLTTSR